MNEGKLALLASRSCSAPAPQLINRLRYPRWPSPLLKRHTSQVVQDGHKFRMAVIGSGPAGFYTAYKVMSSIQDAKVDMYEYLPVPFGLVRFGVAPDHPEVKNCQEKFAEVASSSNFNFVGNVEIGKSLPLELLRDNYTAILFAYGASEDKKLGIPGEDEVRGIYSARHFVGWYNGLPEYADLQPDLSTGDTAVIIGQGNVALDVARTLLTDIDLLRKTDITEHALSALSESRVKHVHIVGRRGPMQASFTIKEVRELMNLPDVSFREIDASLLPPLETKLPRTQRRLVSLLRDGSRNTTRSATKSWSLDNMLSPRYFEGHHSESLLKQVHFHRNKFADPSQRFDSKAKVAAMADDEHVVYPACFAFRSIGYKSVPILGMNKIGVRFNEDHGIIPTDAHGRVVARIETPVRINETPVGIDEIPAIWPMPGLYCTGWVKSGPAGVIANTMEDAFSTADTIASDWAQRKRLPFGGNGWDAISSEAMRRGLRTVSWPDWLKIDAAEKARGRLKGKVREKFTSIPDMLAVLD